MESKILDIFNTLNINLDENDTKYFDNAKLVETVKVSKIKNKAYLHISIDDFLPTKTLQKIETNFKNNQILKLKLIINVSNQNITKDLLNEYISFIKTYKSNRSDAGSWKILNACEFEYNKESNKLIFWTCSEGVKKEIKTELDYCIKKKKKKKNYNNLDLKILIMK